MNDLLKVKAFYYTKAVELGYERAGKLVQVRAAKGTTWVVIGSDEPKWKGFEYRIKPQTVMHPGGEMPASLTSLDGVDVFYTPYFKSDIKGSALKASSTRWGIRVHPALCNDMLKAGLGYKTEEDAAEAAKVIFRLDE